MIIAALTFPPRILFIPFNKVNTGEFVFVTSFNILEITPCV